MYGMVRCVERACRVAVFAFEEKARGDVLEALRAYFSGEGWAAELFVFSEIEPMVEAFHRRRFDMAFTVVDGMMAVEAARLLRQEDATCPLFLISGSGEYAMEGYRLRALDYLLQPVTPQRLGQAVCRIGDTALLPLTGAPPRQRGVAGTKEDEDRI